MPGVSMGGPKLPLSVYEVPGTHMAYQPVCHMKLLLTILWWSLDTDFSYGNGTVPAANT